MDEDELRYKASAGMGLPDVTPYSYALIIAGLQELQSSPRANAAVYDDVDDLVAYLERNVDEGAQRTAEDVLEVVLAMDTTPGVEP